MHLSALSQQFLSILLLIAAFASPIPLGSQESGVEDASEKRVDGSSHDFGPVTPVAHLRNVTENINRQISWCFEHNWRTQVKKETLRHLSPLDEKYETLKNEITEKSLELKHLSNWYYEIGQRISVEYVEAAHLPKELSWRFGLLLGLYGNVLKEMALWNSNYQKENLEQNREINAKVLDYYKISLLFFSYYLGFSESSPEIIQFTALEEIVSHPEFISKIHLDLQREFNSVDETAWIQSIQKLDQQQLEHICGLFRSMYSSFLQNKESLSKPFIRLAAHLSSITTKLLLQAQKNAVYNLDAVNPWMFKLYIDLKKWEALRREDGVLFAPDLKELLPEVQKRCLKLLPHGFSLEDIHEENEYDICNKVRMRNFLSDNQEDLKNGEAIFDEFEFSPVAIRRAYSSLLNFLEIRAYFMYGYSSAIDESDEMTQQIYNYLSAFIEMNDVPITKDNALDYLFVIKLFDRMTGVWNSNIHIKYENGDVHFEYIGFDQFYFPRTTFELRKKILKLCPNLKSYEALTVSVNPQKLRDEKEQTTPGSWLEESEILRQICIRELLENSYHLSNLMDLSPLKGLIVGARGISGAGKSTYLKRHILPFIIPEGVSEHLGIESLAKGILNPDTIKAALKRLQGDTLNTQIHHEGYNAFQEVFRQTSDKGSYILDKRNLTPNEVVTDLIAPAKKCGRSVRLFDFDISLTASISRILARPLHDESPCPEYEALIDGFLSNRRHRAQVVSLANKESAISRYELFGTSKQKLVAHKMNGDHCPLNTGSPKALCIHDLPLFDECLREPTYQEIEEELSQVITDSFIAEAIQRGDIPPEKRVMLEKWRGMTLKESIQQHVQGSKGTCDENLFESITIAPFNGTEWLADFPQLIEFLQCEHLLHIHGVDETGRGLHWEAGQFEEGLNPKYNPDGKAPGSHQSGIQMRIGYFIVPTDKLDLYLSENLSQTVIRELAVPDEKGKLKGLRFFVHPTAYAHFAPLLRAGISFVPPSKSEFMGTPLSSYHSWLIRSVSTNDQKPFIVKMGTPNGCGDIKHLLAGDDIVKILRRQKSLDKQPDRPDFLIFKETAGMILQNIPGYPYGTLDSGIVISEIPEQFLKGDCKIVSLSALMSCERIKIENRGVGTLTNQTETYPLPLIFEVMEAAIQKGLVKTPSDFLKTYFIDGYLQAIEPLVFKEGYSLGGQSQNLYLVLNPDDTIKGFAYRDLEGMIWEKNFLESYSWFYRYTNFIKLLNVLTQSENSDLPSLLGGPIRASNEKPSSERSLYFTLCQILEQESNDLALKALKNYSITSDENLKLLKLLDSSYLDLLRRYFKFDEAVILNADGTIPCAEEGSIAERALPMKNQALWKGRISDIIK